MRWIWIDRFLEFEQRQVGPGGQEPEPGRGLLRRPFPRLSGHARVASSSKGLAQTGGILVGEANDFKEKVVLAKITSARFHREPWPARRLIYDVRLLTCARKGRRSPARCTPCQRAEPEEPSVADAEAEIFFAHLDQARSQQLFGDHNFVFSGELKHLLGLAKADGPAHGRRH